MAYEARPSGAHAMTCDVPGCSHECLSPGVDELQEDLALAGWVKAGKDKANNDLFQCPACSQGTHPAAAALHAATGGTGEVPVEAPMSVSKGDAFYNPDGDLVGHYTEDAQAGDEVNVKVQLPEPPAPVSDVDTYDEMMEGSDDDDDQHGRVSAVAPSRGGVGAGTVAVVGQTIPATPNAPAVPTAAAQAALATPSQGAAALNTAALNETAALFDNLDPTDSDWDPDDD